MEKLKSISEALLQEIFAQENQLREKSIEEVGALLEQAKEIYETPEPAPLEDIAPNKESYERVTSLYCELLLEIEASGLILDFTEPLDALIEGRTRTIVNLPGPTPDISRPRTVVATQDEETFDNPQDGSQEDKWIDAPMDLPPLQGGLEQESLWKADSDLGKTYIQLAQYLDLLTKDPAFPADPSYGDRLVCQNLCFALEAECLDKLRPHLNPFWGERENAIRSILNPDSQRFELNPRLHQDLIALAEAHAEWLPEGRLSIPGILNCLHYFVSSKNSQLEPSLMESAVLLLLFARKGGSNAFPLQQFLPLHGLEDDEVIECAFRLIKAQKIRNKAFTATATFTSDTRAEVEKELLRLFCLIEKCDARHVNQTLNGLEGAA